MSSWRSDAAVDAAYSRFLGLALGSIVVAVTAVIGSAVYVYGAFGRVAAEISGDAIPSMLVLADARTELQQVRIGLEAALDSPDADTSPEQEGVTAALHRLAESLEQYRALPISPGEAELWPELEVGEAEVAASAGHILGRQRSADPRSSGALARELRRSANHLDAALARTIRVNGAAARGVGEMASAVRHTAVPVALALSVLGFVIATGAIAMASHLVRNALQRARYASEREREGRLALERQARELEAFSGSVAHDLLGPLMTVGLALNLAEQRLPPAEKESVAGALAAAERSLSGVRQLVDGLLQFARASARPRPEDRADACEIVKGVIDDHLPLARRAGVAIDVACSPAVVACSPGVLISITGNLLRNAVAALADSPVRSIRVRISPEPPLARIEVEDTGPGIEPERQPAIFEPHVRGPHGGRSGLGLGLATVKRLVESSGGGLGLASEPGKGALFWVTLPLAPRAET